MAFPLGALELVATGEDLEVTALVRIFDGEVVRASREVPVVIPCTASHFPALVVDPAGVAVVAVDRGTAGRCRVCGDDLEGPQRRCALCDTPHHPECWEYNAGCSTFGCRGTPAPSKGGIQVPEK